MSSEYVVNAEMQSQLCAMIMLGCSLRRAAGFIGLAESTIRNTMVRDPAFAAQIRAAERNREIIPLKNLRNASEKSWRANAWLLERLNPHDYARRYPRQMTAEELGDAL